MITYTDSSRKTEGLTILSQFKDCKLFVYEAYSSSRKTKCVLKLFPKTKFGVTQYAKEKLMFNLSHKNLIKRIPMICHDDRFYPLLTEHAQYGDFFNLVTKGYLVNEVIVRTYFHQLIAGLEYIHSQGVAHLDLKLDNILLGNDMQLKIIDFDQAQSTKDDVITSGGTVCYRAPEVIDGSCSEMTAADIFSAGVMLFAFLARQFPFTEKEDPTATNVNCYSTFVNNNEHFWTGKIKQRGKNIFSEDFMDLVNGMCNDDALERYTISQIKCSKWYRGPVLDDATLQTQMRAVFHQKNKK